MRGHAFLLAGLNGSGEHERCSPTGPCRGEESHHREISATFRGVRSSASSALGEQSWRMLSISPARELAPFVVGYWFLRDLAGNYAGQPIRTPPHPHAVLTVNFGRPCTDQWSNLVPKLSLLGLQNRVRQWGSGTDCFFVMAMLTIPGAVHLFPNVGASASDTPLELGALVGDRVCGRLGNNLHEEIDPKLFAARINRWLLERLDSTRVREFQRFAAAYDTLKRTGSVELAARAADVSTRQFERWCQTHVGEDPRTLVALHRLQASVYAVQTGGGDPGANFSDQPHQIRSWRRWLGTTPRLYSRSPLSPMAFHFTRAPGAQRERIAHWL